MAMNYRNNPKYKIKNKERFRELYYFALQYSEWKKELSAITVIGSPNIDGMPKGASVGDPTGRIATSQAELISKITLVEQCAKDADPSIYKGVLKGVTTPNMTYNWLVYNKYLYCGRDKYYIARSRFYWLLNQRKGP